MITDNLFETMTNITKAHAYDIISVRAQELEIENRQLKDKIKLLENPNKGIYHVDGHDLTSVIMEYQNTIGTPYPAYKHICKCDFGYADPEKHFEINKSNAKLIANALNQLK